jgi:hypothetical protein
MSQGSMARQDSAPGVTSCMAASVLPRESTFTMGAVSLMGA